MATVLVDHHCIVITVVVVVVVVVAVVVVVVALVKAWPELSKRFITVDASLQVIGKFMSLCLIVAKQQLEGGCRRQPVLAL